MDIRPKSKVVVNDVSSHIQLYINPPTFDVSLDEFKELGTARQRVLQETSNLHEKQKRGDLTDFNDKMKTNLKQLLTSSSIFEEKQRDLISHYILRLAYCESEDLRRWFLSQEVALLQFRLSQATYTDLDMFLHQYEELFPFVKVEIAKDNTEEMKSFNEISNDCEFYKVHFFEVLDLVQRRSVLIKKGYAFIPVHRKDLTIALICNKFRSIISHDLVRMVSYISDIKNDERIAATIKRLRMVYNGHDFKIDASKLNKHISLQDLDKVSRESYPPCMRHLHESLRKEHHLRHFGRLQYGLFLKSIGISVDQALEFWRNEFTQKIELDKFEKQHAYNIRHSYGKEGKRTNYTPYSCLKVITSAGPGAGDHHGCPFKHWDTSSIRKMLKSYEIPENSLTGILHYAEDSHYQLACQSYFDITHEIDESVFSLEHPTQYYLESRRLKDK